MAAHYCIGDDWAEDHHDIEVQDPNGRKLAAARLPEGAEGIAKFHELVAKHAGEEPDPAEVVVGIETDRGTWVQALIAAGYQVYAINPRQVARFKQQYATSGAKSDKAMLMRSRTWSASMVHTCGRSPGTASRRRLFAWWPAPSRR